MPRKRNRGKHRKKKQMGSTSQESTETSGAPAVDTRSGESTPAFTATKEIQIPPGMSQANQSGGNAPGISERQASSGGAAGIEAQQAGTLPEAFERSTSGSPEQQRRQSSSSGSELGTIKRTHQPHKARGASLPSTSPAAGYEPSEESGMDTPVEYPSNRRFVGLGKPANASRGDSGSSVASHGQPNIDVLRPASARFPGIWSRRQRGAADGSGTPAAAPIAEEASEGTDEPDASISAPSGSGAEGAPRVAPAAGSAAVSPPSKGQAGGGGIPAGMRSKVRSSPVADVRGGGDTTADDGDYADDEGRAVDRSSKMRHKHHHRGNEAALQQALQTQRNQNDAKRGAAGPQLEQGAVGSGSGSGSKHPRSPPSDSRSEAGSAGIIGSGSSRPSASSRVSPIAKLPPLSPSPSQHGADSGTGYGAAHSDASPSRSSWFFEAEASADQVLRASGADAVASPEARRSDAVREQAKAMAAQEENRRGAGDASEAEEVDEEEPEAEVFGDEEEEETYGDDGFDEDEDVDGDSDAGAGAGAGTTRSDAVNSQHQQQYPELQAVPVVGRPGTRMVAAPLLPVSAEPHHVRRIRFGLGLQLCQRLKRSGALRADDAARLKRMVLARHSMVWAALEAFEKSRDVEDTVETMKQVLALDRAQ